MLLLGIALCSLNCTLEFDGDDYFFFEHKGADMPVSVQGNVSSRTFLIFMHGGPGDSGIMTQDIPCWSALKQDIAVVLWDQRNSGFSQGNSAPPTYDLIAEDLELLISILHEHYAIDHLFLAGHSWGGFMAKYYLRDPTQQDQFAGFIDIAGSYDLPLTETYVREFMLDYAGAQIAAGQDASYWQEAMEWYATTEGILLWENIFTHGEYAIASHAAVLEGTVEDYTAGSLSPGTRLNGSYSPIASMINGLGIASLLWNDYMQSSLPADQLGQIALPTLLIWGRHDGVVPVPMAQILHDRLGTPDVDKDIYVLEHSAHYPFLEEPDLVAARILQFINAYSNS